MLIPKIFWNHKHYFMLHVQDYDLGGDGGHTFLTFGYSLCKRWAKLHISPENTQEFIIKEQVFIVYEQFYTRSHMNLWLSITKIRTDLRGYSNIKNITLENDRWGKDTQCHKDQYISKWQTEISSRIRLEVICKSLKTE